MNDQSDSMVTRLTFDKEEQAVLDFLQQDPEFFIRHAAAVEQIRIPHPVRDSVSLVEWQLARQRAKIDLLEQEISTLMEQASANQQLFRQLLTLQTELATAENLVQWRERLRRWARELGLSGAYIRLFAEKWQISAPYDCIDLGITQQAFESIRIQRLGRGQHYLGPLHGPELQLLLPETVAVGSIAMSLMTYQSHDVGILLFTSRNPYHYQAGMGTALLDLLSELLPPLLTRWINYQ